MRDAADVQTFASGKAAPILVTATVGEISNKPELWESSYRANIQSPQNKSHISTNTSHTLDHSCGAYTPL